MDASTNTGHGRKTEACEIPFRGIHHLALTTDNMKMTTEFYVNVLGMPLVHAMKA